MARATDAKMRGNALVKEKSYAAAADCYTRALRELETIPVGDEAWIALHCAVLANRALAALKVGKPGDCVADCDALLALDSRHVKALYRKGLALEELGKLAAAESAFAAAVGSDAKSSNKAASAALARVRRKRGGEGQGGRGGRGGRVAGGGGESKGSSSKSAKKKTAGANRSKPAKGKSNFDLSGLYDEKPGAKERKREAKRKSEAAGAKGTVSEKEHAERLYNRVQRMVDEAAANGVGGGGGGDGCNDASHGHSHGPPGLDRTFQAMMGKKVFRARLFQGIEYGTGWVCGGGLGGGG